MTVLIIAYVPNPLTSGIKYDFIMYGHHCIIGDDNYFKILD